jgi:hypothetical protein
MQLEWGCSYVLVHVNDLKGKADEFCLRDVFEQCMHFQAWAAAHAARVQQEQVESGAAYVAQMAEYLEECNLTDGQLDRPAIDFSNCAS